MSTNRFRADFSGLFLWIPAYDMREWQRGRPFLRSAGRNVHFALFTPFAANPALLKKEIPIV